jgi:hypothetical protein
LAVEFRGGDHRGWRCRLRRFIDAGSANPGVLAIGNVSLNGREVAAASTVTTGSATGLRTCERSPKAKGPGRFAELGMVLNAGLTALIVPLTGRLLGFS